MSMQTITIHLPGQLYNQVRQRAQRMKRPVQDELVAVVAEALPTLEDLPDTILNEMMQLAYLNNEELQRAAQSRMGEEENERMQALILKRQRTGLNTVEQEEMLQLQERYDQIMLLRAQAAVLLQGRADGISAVQV